MKNDIAGCVMVFLSVIGFIALLFLSPLIHFAISFIGGMITEFIMGDILVKALNILFNTTYFAPNMIPWISGALGFIGGFFKKTVYKNKKD